MWVFLWALTLLLSKPSCYTGPAEELIHDVPKYKCMRGFYTASTFNSTFIRPSRRSKFGIQSSRVQKICCFSYLDYLMY